MKKLFLLCCMFLLTVLGLKAQSTLTVADGTATDSYIPVYGFYMDAAQKSQSIYPASMLTSLQGGQISGLTYYFSSTPSSNWGGTQTVKIGITTASTLSGFLTETTTLVWTGTLANCINGNTMHLVFDQGFTYTGGNLLIEVEQPNSSSYSSASFYGENQSANSSYMYYYSAHSTSFLPKVTFDYQTGTCFSPGALTASGTNDNSTTLSWTPSTVGTPDSYTVAYRPASDTTFVEIPNITDTFYQLSGLTSSTTYYWKVKTTCSGNDESGWSGTSSFMTSQIAAQLPYNGNFEDTTENAQWTLETSGTNRWYIGTAANNTDQGTMGLYISSDNGATNGYNTGTTTNTWAYRDIDFGTTSAEYNLSFDYRSQGESCCDYVKVFIGQPTTPSGNSTPTGATQLGGNLNNTSNWTHVSYNFNSSYSGVQRLYFLWHNDGSVGTNPSGAIDNISIAGTNCGRPYALSLDSTTSTTIVAHFTAALETDGAWQYVIVNHGDTIDATQAVDITDTNFEVSNLTPNTLYDIYVRTDCGGEYSFWSSVLSVRTQCVDISLPYTENFDSFTSGSGSQPTCWMFPSTTYPYISSSYHTSGSNSLYFSYYASTAIMPRVPDQDSLGDPINLTALRLRFNARHTSSSYSITVGVMTDPNDANTFTAIQAINPGSNTSSFEPMEVFFTTYTGTGRYIAFKNASGNYMYIDDVVLDYAPACGEVSHLEVSDVEGTSAMLTWEDSVISTTSSFTVEYSEYGQDNWTIASASVTNTYYLLSGLDQQTRYDVRVRVNCDDGSFSNYTATDFTTTCMAGGNVQIGNGTSSSSYLPSYSCYNYSMSEQLFTASELGGSNTFSSIAFQVSSIPSTPGRNWTIYLMPTTQTSLTGVVAVDTTTAVQVFSGAVSNIAPGWVTVNFTIPYQYDGQSNLILIVDDNTGSYSCSNYFYYHSNPNGNSYYYYSDYTNPNPLSPSGFYSNTNRANVIFGGACDSLATCIRPNMFVNNITYNSADVIWAAGYQETSWELEYKQHSDTVWTSFSNPTGFNVTLTGLAAQTAYDVRLRADCGGDYSDWVSASFTTDCGPVETIPYSNDFETYASIDGTNYLNCWYRCTNDPSHYVYIFSGDGTTSGASTNHCLDFHHTPAPTKVIAVLPQMGSSIDVSTLMASFYLRMTENQSAAIFEIGVMTDPTDANTFETVDTVTMTNQAWTYVNAPLTNYNGSGKYIAFRVSNGTGHGFRLDDLTIDYTPSCLGPQGVTATNITTSDADISWTEMGDATSWNIEYGVHGFTPGQGDGVQLSNVTNPVSITGLTNATMYDVYVTSNCGGGAVSNMSPIYSFATLLCDTADRCNYTFNMTDGYGDGWNNASISVYTNGIFVTTVSLSSGSNATATVALCDQTTTTLKWNSGYYDDEISFTFVNPFGDVIFTCDEGDADNFSTTVPFCTDSTNCTAPTCPRPMNLAVVSTTTTSVELGWTEMGTSTSWNIEYGPSGFTQGTGTTVVATTNPFTVTNLEDTVEYDFYIQADCGGGDVSEWRGPLTTYPGIYEMATTGTDTVQMCGGIIYDHGGATGSYSASSNSTLIIMPDQPGMLVSLQGTYSTESCCDKITIYDGIGTSGTQLGQYGGTGNITAASTVGALTINFYSDASVQYDGFALQVSCTPAPTCMKPVSLAASGATTTSVNLSWTEMGTATTWNIEYGPSGFAHGAGTTVVATSNPFTLTGLTAATNYQVYVQADCGGGDLSEWSTPIVFATECDVISTFPYTQGFENGGQAPACWTNSYVSGSTDWGFQAGNYSSYSSVTTAHTGSYNAYFFNSSGNTTKYVSPIFDLSQVTNPYVSYWYSQEAWGSDQDQLKVYYRTSSTDTWTLLASHTNDVSTWTFDSLALPTPSATYQIAFEGMGDYGYGITLDDITVAGDAGVTPPTPTTCDAPTGLNAFNITQTSANIQWTAGGTETAWNLQYKAASATSWSSSIAVSTTPAYAITGLTANTAYNVRVQADCGSGSTSDWVVANFTTLDEEQQECPAPTNFRATDITKNSVTLAWDQQAGTANEWEINYKQASATTWTNITVTTNPYTITDLTPETAYSAQILAHCVNGVNSDATEPISFSTLADGIEDYVLDNSTVLYPNPTTGLVTIRNEECGMRNVKVYDVYGKLITTVKVNVNVNVVTLDATSFAAGIYFAQIETEKGVVTKRFVKK